MDGRSTNQRTRTRAGHSFNGHPFHRLPFLFCSGRLNRAFAFAGLLFGMLLLPACNEQIAESDPSSPSNASQSTDLPPDDGITAQEILDSALKRYASARSYSDRAVLYMSYRMNGQPIQEPQPWATSWDNQGRFGANLFNAQIRSDGQRFSCYVYDIDSGNLDNQRMLLANQGRVPIEDVFTDPVARHFVAGYSEMPLDENQAQRQRLIPPPISLLIGAKQQPKRLENSWLQRPDRMQRMADATIDDRLCRVIRITDGETTSDVWVDAETGTIWQMSLPLQFLDERVTSSPDITDLLLVARFHEAEFDQALDSEFITLKPHPGSTPVRKFVKLPESFPSELIGKKAPKFEMFTRAGKTIGRDELKGKSTTLVWLAGPSSLDSIAKLNRMAEQFNNTDRRLAIVFSDSEIVDPAGGLLALQPKFAEAANNSKLPFYYDQQLSASTALKIKAIPAAIVLDRDSRVQFARAIGDDAWDEDLLAAVERVESGEDVAGEMTAEYQRFLDSYHQQLVSVSAARLAKGLDDVATGAAAPVRIQNANIQSGSLRLRADRVWANDQFKQPGNVTVVRHGDRLRTFVFDGWLTVVELDQAGQTLERHELSLPEKAALNLLRATVDANGKLWFAAFDSLANGVFIFDEQWNSVARYPATELEHKGIQDCQFATMDGDSVLLVAFADQQGVQKVRLSDGSSQPYCDSICDSIADGKLNLATSQGSVGTINANGVFKDSGNSDWRFNRISRISGNAFATGMTSAEDWHLIGMNGVGKYRWSVPVGSQFFDTQIQPLQVCQVAGQTVCAVADTSGRIAFVSATGKWLGEFRCSGKLRGMNLVSRGGRPHLIVASDSIVEGFDLQFVSNPVQPASSK